MQILLLIDQIQIQIQIRSCEAAGQECREDGDPAHGRGQAGRASQSLEGSLLHVLLSMIRSLSGERSDEHWIQAGGALGFRSLGLASTGRTGAY